MTHHPKIADQHLSKQACIYIRQSTLAQVRFNQESTDRQYNLVNKALSLGWRQDQIRVLDRDLGHSGAASSDKIAPIWPIATSLTKVLKSIRPLATAPDWPRSRSRTRILA